MTLSVSFRCKPIMGLAIMLAGCGRGTPIEEQPKVADAPPPSLRSFAPGRIVSDPLPDPMVLSDGDREYVVTRIELNVPRGKNSGTITFDESSLEFDDFGDATTTNGRPPTTWQVELIKADAPTNWHENLNKNKSHVFDLQFPDGQFENRLRVAFADQPEGEHRLIVRPTKNAEKANPERILILNPPKIAPDELGNGPQSDRFHFRTLAFLPTRDDRKSSFACVEVEGGLARTGLLDIDCNYYSFYQDGSLASTTMLYYSPYEIAFRFVKADPKGDRRVFELVGDGLADRSPSERFERFKYFLVLASQELGPHRLIVKKDEKVRHVFSLTEVDRAAFLAAYRELEKVPADEKAAIADIRRQSGYRFQFDVEDGRVRGLHIRDGDLNQLDDAIGRLPELRSLTFSKIKMTASGLPSLSRLKRLMTLDFWQCEVADDGLVCLTHVPQLKRLSLFDCNGFSADMLKHLSPLENLSMLAIRNEEKRTDPLQFDDGLKYLAKMKHLHDLNLQGQRISDAGLEHISKLTRLRSLCITGDGITEAGRQKLQSRLPDLKEFRVY